MTKIILPRNFHAKSSTWYTVPCKYCHEHDHANYPSSTGKETCHCQHLDILPKPPGLLDGTLGAAIGTPGRDILHSFLHW